MEDVQHQQMGYDRAATMFAPDGHILQVEYAEKTIRLGSASVGIVCKDGVILIADRRQRDKLVFCVMMAIWNLEKKKFAIQIYTKYLKTSTEGCTRNIY